jgi:RNA polymerase sigma-70 factor (ECF subfamily)
MTMRMGNAAAPTPTDSAPQGASSSVTPSSAAPARAPRSAHDAIAFKRELTGVIPHLRAFARGLCGRPDLADDLVQETLLKAWAAQERFEPGTSMRAWTFVILRNAYLTDMRRNRFRADYDETVAERVLVAPAGQEGPLHLSDMHRALLTLPRTARGAAAGGRRRLFLRGSRADLPVCGGHDQEPRGPRPCHAVPDDRCRPDPRRSTDDSVAHDAIMDELDATVQLDR